MFYESQILPSADLLKDIQILVVDNDADSQYLYKILLEIHGAQVTAVKSIADAVVFLDCLVPDLLICEIRFFDEDVLALIQRVKAVSLGGVREIPILVVSAYCSAGFAQSLLTMVEEHLLKPIDIDHLAGEVWNLVHLGKSAQKRQCLRVAHETQKLDETLHPCHTISCCRIA